jgi:hypothetical protein
MSFEKSLEWYLRAKGMRQEPLFQDPAQFDFTLGGFMMIAKAIEKIKAEIDSNKTNTYVQIIGGFLLDYLDKNPQAAEKIMDKEKTITKSLEDMRNAASKKKTGNFAMLSDREAFGIVLKYYGIDGAPGVYVPPGSPAPVQPKPVKEIDFDISLNDLL